MFEGEGHSSPLNGPILEPLTKEVTLTYENWRKSKEKAAKTAIMPDAMTQLEVWDSGDTSILPGIYPVAEVYGGHDEVVLHEVRYYLTLDGFVPGPVVLSYKDVMGLIGLGLADYS
jgi:hypothetical protein